MEDNFGNRIKLVYPAHGKLVNIIDTLDREIQFIQNHEEGRLETVGDFEGNDWSYDMYTSTDQNGNKNNLASVSTPTISYHENPFPNGRKESYGYYGQNKNHLLKWIQDAEGNSNPNIEQKLIEISYYEDQEKKGHVSGQKYGVDSFQFEIVDENQSDWIDRKGNRIKNIFSPQSFSPDLARFPKEKTVTVNGRQLKYRYDYSSSGLLLKVIFPLGNGIEFLYDSSAIDQRNKGNLLTTKKFPDTNRPSFVTRNVGNYNWRNNPQVTTISEIKYEYTYEPELQFLKTATDPLGRTTTWNYDNGFLEVILPTITHGGPEGQQQERREKFLWNRMGQLIKKIDANNVVTTYGYYPNNDPYGIQYPDYYVSSYDALAGGAGLLAVISYDMSDDNVVRNPNLGERRPISHRFYYDKLGNLKAKSLREPVEFEFINNELGEVVEEKGPNQTHLIKYRYDFNGRLKETESLVRDINFPPDVISRAYTVEDKFEYDRFGNLTVSSINYRHLNLKTILEYDKNENLEYVRTPVANGSIHQTYPRQYNRIHYYYNEADQLELEVIGREIGGNKIIQQFSYDGNGNLEYVSRPPQGEIQNIYDGFDRKIKVKDAKNNEFTIHLDDVGNVTREAIKGIVDGIHQTNSPLYEIINFFDEGDRLIHSKQSSFNLRLGSNGNYSKVPIERGYRISSYKYDNNDQLIEENLPGNLITKIKRDGHNKLVEYIDNIGTSLQIWYNNAHQPITTKKTSELGITILQIEYDIGMRPKLKKVNNKIKQKIFYNSLGNVRIQEDPNRNRILYNYDSADRLTKKTHVWYKEGKSINEDGSSISPIFSTMLMSYDENSNMIYSFDFSKNIIETLQYNEANLLQKRTLGNAHLLFQMEYVTIILALKPIIINTELMVC